MKIIKRSIICLALLLLSVVLAACGAKEYVVTFETDGGTVVESITTTGQVTLPVDPTKSGYEFNGWYVDSEFNQLFDETQLIVQNTTLYAKWEKIYTVTLMLQGGKISNKEEYKFQSTANVVLPPDPVKSGYWFNGWFYDLEYVNKVDTTALTISSNLTLYAKWEEAYLSTNLTDGLQIPSIENKSFKDHGIGEVQLVNCTDGDTIQVRDKKAAEPELMTIRFLAVNTPESTAAVEPWGFAASNFTKSKLMSAHSVVIEFDDLDKNGIRTDSNGRYLGYVWYQPKAGDPYRNLCLELIEQAYSRYSFNSNSKYHDLYVEANTKASATGERVWGTNNDPDYNYDKGVISTTIYNMLQNGASNVAGTQYNITARVTLQCGRSFYIEDVNPDENGNVGTVYVYGGFNVDYYRNLGVGDIINMNCKLQYEGNFGTQLTDIKKLKYVTKAANLELYEYEEISPSEFKTHLGAAVKVSGCEYIGSYQSETDKENSAGKNYFVGSFKFKKDGKVFNYRVSKDLNGTWSPDAFEVGKKYDLIGGVTEYYGDYQLAAPDTTKLAMEEVKVAFDNYMSKYDLSNPESSLELLNSYDLSSLTISWASNDEAIKIVEKDGKVAAEIGSVTKDTQVTLTVTLKYRTLVVTRNYIVTVKVK